MGFNFIKKILFNKFTVKYPHLLAKINLKPTEFCINPNSKCLCLCPHPDDESIGMGGFLSKFKDNFDVILLTDGRKGIAEKSAEEVTQIRENEFSNAMKIAGIENFKFLRIPDKKLLDNMEKFKTIDISEYDYIFIPNFIDQHPDHKACGILLNELIKSGAKTKKSLQICFYEVWATLGFVNSFCDITDFIENKRKMIASYPSQTSQKNYEYHAIGLNQYRGMLKDKQFVEAFCTMEVKNFEKMLNLYE